MQQSKKVIPSNVSYNGPAFDVQTTLMNLIREFNLNVGPDKQNIIPAGGTTGQTLKKASNNDYDVVWG